MKKLLLEFFRRGLVACGFGPMVLAAVYLILQHSCGLQSLTVNEVTLGILSLTLLAFVAGGMNVLYQVERLPLMSAILIHGLALYLGYLLTYLVNGWLEWGTAPILVFTVIFVLTYLVIWVVIYSITKRDTDRLNAMLQHNRRHTEPPTPQ